MVTARGIVDDYLARGFDSQPYRQMDELFASDESGPLDFVLTCLDHLRESVTFAADAISYVPEAQLPQVTTCAIRALALGALDGRSYAEEVIERLSLQAPHLLTPHLPLLWELRPSEQSYSALWPWRSADSEEVARLRGLTRGADARRAVEALLETGDRETVTSLIHEDPGLPGGWGRVSELITFYGFDSDSRPLVPPACFHLVPSERPDLGFAAGPFREPHPTWVGEPSQDAWLGGESTASCAICDSPLHILLELDEVPAGLGVSAHTLTLATCLSCVGWPAPHLFMAHVDGRVEPVHAPPPASPEFPSVGLMRQSASLVPTVSRWQRQDWGVSNSRENLNRLGGAPTWVQSAEHPSCPGCGRTMTALMQLDSFLPMADGGELYWGSGGIGYVTWCDACAISAVGWQCT